MRCGTDADCCCHTNVYTPPYAQLSTNKKPLSSRAVVARVPRAISQPTRLPLQPPSQFLKVRICVERRRRDIHRQPGAPPQEARHRRHERWKRDSPLERVIWNQKSIHGIEARLQRLVYGRRDWSLGRCPRLQHETAPLGAKQIEGETIQSLPQAADRLSFLRSDRWRCLPRHSLDGASRESGSTPQRSVAPTELYASSGRGRSLYVLNSLSAVARQRRINHALSTTDSPPAIPSPVRFALRLPG